MDMVYAHIPMIDATKQFLASTYCWRPLFIVYQGSDFAVGCQISRTRSHGSISFPDRKKSPEFWTIPTEVEQMDRKSTTTYIGFAHPWRFLTITADNKPKFVGTLNKLDITDKIMSKFLNCIEVPHGPSRLFSFPSGPPLTLDEKDQSPSANRRVNNAIYLYPQDPDSPSGLIIGSRGENGDDKDLRIMAVLKRVENSGDTLSLTGRLYPVRDEDLGDPITCFVAPASSSSATSILLSSPPTDSTSTIHSQSGPMASSSANMN